MSLMPFPYVGSKRLDIKYYSKYLPRATDIDISIEPFGGSGYNSLILFSKNNKIKSRIYDNDEGLINFFKQMKTNYDALIDSYNDLLNPPPTRDEYKKLVQEYKGGEGTDTRKALLKLFLSKFHGIRQFMYPSESKKIGLINKNKFDVFRKWLECTEFILSDYNVTFEMLRKDDINKRCFIFLDPPYVDSYNGYYTTYSQQKINVDNTKIFIDIIDLLKDCNNTNIMMILNKNALTSYIYKDYVKGEYDKMYSLTQKKAIHLIICNYGAVY